MFAVRSLSHGLHAAPARWAATGTKTPLHVNPQGRALLRQNVSHRNKAFKEATLQDLGVYPLLICLGCGAALGLAQLVRYMAYCPDVKFDRQKRKAEIPSDEEAAVSWVNGLHKTLRGEEDLDKIGIPPFNTRSGDQ